MQQQGIIPWTKLVDFVKIYTKTIQSQIENEQDGTLTKAQIEPLLPALFKKLHSTLTAILNDDMGEEIKREQEEIEKNKVHMIIKIM
jgi:hypothetical protein